MIEPGVNDSKAVDAFYEDCCHGGWCEFDADWLEHRFAQVRAEGAAVAFGIIGMAEAIRENGPRIVERHYWTSSLDGACLYDCRCPGCGCQMKCRTAGVHEGTDLEWCGACRDSL